MTTPSKENDIVDLKKLFLKCLHNWYWFAGSVIICVVLALFYYFSKTPVYEVSSTFKFRENEQANNISFGNSSMLNMFGIGGATINSDETEIINSRAIMRQTIVDLDLQTEYRKKKGMRWYGQYPSYDLEILYPVQFCDTMRRTTHITLTRTKRAYRIAVKYGDLAKSKHAVFSLDEPVRTCIGDISFLLHTDLKPGDKYRIKTTPMPSLVDNYRKILKAEEISKETNVICLQTVTDMPSLAEAMIRRMLALYDLSSVVDKRLQASNSERFIDSRLSLVASELDSVENSVKQYKIRNQITNLSNEAILYLQNTDAYQKQIVEIETQQNLIQYIQEFVQDTDNAFNLIPANLGVQDQSLVALIQEYNTLLLRRMKLQRAATDDNPALLQINEQLESMRGNILTSIHSVRDGLEITHNNLLRQEQAYNARTENVPAQEKEYIAQMRQQNIKQAIYLFLYQKREENAISLISTVTPTRIIDTAQTTPDAVAPRKKIIFGGTLFLGLLLPVLVFFVLELLNTKIRNREEYDKYIRLPLLGQLNKAPKGSLLPVLSENTLSEQVRFLRQKLIESKSQVILVTSAETGEGKTFVASNLALSLSLLNKKVLLIDANLRNPEVATVLQLNASYGLTDYLSQQQTGLSSLITTKDALDILPAGSAALYPNELLHSGSLVTLMSTLREQYDYIVIDTAMVGTFSDTFALASFADTTLFVIRSCVTTQSSANYINNLYEQNRLPHTCAILNAVQSCGNSAGC